MNLYKNIIVEEQFISNEKLIEIFLTQLNRKKNLLNFNGIILEPRLSENKRILFFDIKNPNDLSYSKVAINLYINQEFNYFIRVLGLDRFSLKFNGNNHFGINSDEYYLNSTDYKQIKNLITNVKRFRYRHNDDVLEGDIRYWSEVFYINSYYELIELSVSASFDNFQIVNHKEIIHISRDELNDSLDDDSEFADGFNDYLQDELFDDALNYIWNIPTFCDQSTMSMTCRIV